MSTSRDGRVTTTMRQNSANPQSPDLGADYAAAVAANPYLQSYYKEDFWDKIGNFFGFNTRADSYESDRLQRAAAYNSQLVNQKREEDYNNPVSQVARERAAGLNPDINGSVTPGAAAENVEPEAAAAPESNITPEGLFNSFGQVISFGISFASQISDLAAKGLSLSSGRVALRQSIADQAIQDWDNVVGSWSPEDVADSIKYSTTADRYSRDNTVGATNPYRKGTREYRLYSRAAKQYRMNHPAVAKRYFDLHNQLATSAMEYGSNPLRSVKGFDDSGNFNVVFDAFKPLASLRKSTMAASEQNANTEATSTIPNELDARESAAKLSKQQSDKSYDIGKTISQIISNLSDIADSDKYSDTVRFFANGCLMAMYFLSNTSASVGKGSKGQTMSVGF